MTEWTSRSHQHHAGRKRCGMNQRNLKDVRTANRANVLRLICERPGLTRQNVADKLRLSKMSAVNIVTEYVEKGYMR